MKPGRTEDATEVCKSCGATVYREHLESGIARYEDGRLMCAHCVAELESSSDSESSKNAFEPIAFEDDTSSGSSVQDAMSQSRIHAASKQTLGGAGGWDESKFRRVLRPDNTGASRCRIFHCKLTVGAVDFMVNQINEWFEANDQIVAKFMTSTIGPFEGKHVENNLIVTVFY